LKVKANLSSETHLNQQAGLVMSICDLTYVGETGRRIVVQDWSLDKKRDLIQKISKFKEKLWVWFKL
jgi:hypothetical protein